MIHYQLRCSAEHGFDGWFRSGDAFDAQAARGLVACPACGDTAVHRALMAPRIAKRGRMVDPEGAPAATLAGDTLPEKAAAAMPDQMRSMLQKLRAEIERTGVDVGAGFAEEARRIHRGESDKRAIYGEATPAQAEALADEGIAVSRIPWVPRADG